MDDVVAVEVAVADGGRCYFMTWGRIFSNVDRRQIEELVLEHAGGFALGSRATGARVCATLGEARDSPYFHEALISFAAALAQRPDDLDAWKTATAAGLRSGQEIYFLGRVGERG